MKFDIIVVTFNSAKWISSCLNSLKNSDYNTQNLYLTFVDNGSQDETVELLELYQDKSEFGGFQIITAQKNLGFGRANNLGVDRTSQDYVFFLNIDTEVDRNCFNALKNEIDRSNSTAALWECRQFPYEHPKFYNPITLDTTWASGAASVVNRRVFLEVGMFDDNIFMYAEDVDLSWRIRAAGYRVLYCPKCVVHHYTYQSAGEVKPTQFYNSTYNNLMLRFKYGTRKDIVNGYFLYSSLFIANTPFSGHRKRVIRNLIKSFIEGPAFRHRSRQIRKTGFKPNFRIWDYEIVREGSFYVNQFPEKFPLVSILIRTCQRPNVLRETLLSLRNQTYPNIEIIIVEDGIAFSKNMIETEFSDLNINYQPTIQKVGRCEAGNLAMKLARGKYFNFLDDDDVMFADHVEVLVNTLEKNPGFKAAYSFAFETPIKIFSENPYKYQELYHNLIYRQSFNRLILLHHNYFPIQTVMFSRSFYDKFGGFDPELEVLEDWDLWLRYALHEEFIMVEKVTSMYRVPSDANTSVARQQKLDIYLKKVREKHAANGAVLPVTGVLKDIEGLMSKGTVVIQHIKQGRFDVIYNKLKIKIKSKIKNSLRG